MEDQRTDDRNDSFVDLKRRVIHTEDRLSEIKKELSDLNGSIKELNVTISAMGKPHYQTWAAIGLLISAVTSGAWWLAISPINDHMKSIDLVDATILPREVSLEKFGQCKDEMRRLQNEIDSRASKDDLNRLIIEIDRRLPKRDR